MDNKDVLARAFQVEDELRTKLAAAGVALAAEKSKREKAEAERDKLMRIVTGCAAKGCPICSRPSASQDGKEAKP
mgnify:CR=1 FL=1